MQKRFELLMDAGNGAQKAGDVLIHAIAELGYHVFIEPLIPAEISPPKRTPYSMSGAVIRISDQALSNIGNYSSVMVVEHEILLKRRLEDQEFQENAVIILDMADQRRAADAYEAVIKDAESAGLTVIQLHRTDLINDQLTLLNGRGKNMVYLGVLAAYFQIPLESIKRIVQKVFKRLSADVLSQNINLVDLGYQLATEAVSKPYALAKNEKESGEQILIDGNTALSMGIIDAGIKLYSGYPITPASSIMHTLSKVFSSYGGVVHQAEDEISAIGTAIGAYYAGTPSITATSGPGFALKQEFIGLAQSTEIPCIVVDVQRGGPSTGLPTRTEQSDLASAISGCHGDNTKVVLAVTDVEDCFYVPHVARYLTEILKVPVIILSDYMTSVSYKVLKPFDLAILDKDIHQISDTILQRFGISRLPKDIEMVVTNQAIPGEPELMRRVTGLNTDETGQVEYSADSNSRSHRVRNEKLHAVKDGLSLPPVHGKDSGDVLVLTWGSSKGAVYEAVDMAIDAGLSVSGLSLKVLNPISDQIKDLCKNFKTVLSVELAYGDDKRHSTFTQLMRSETLIDIKPAYTQTTGRPVKPMTIFEAIKGAIS